jgi:hypothetical protein
LRRRNHDNKIIHLLKSASNQLGTPSIDFYDDLPVVYTIQAFVSLIDSLGFFSLLNDYIFLGIILLKYCRKILNKYINKTTSTLEVLISELVVYQLFS